MIMVRLKTRISSFRWRWWWRTILRVLCRRRRRRHGWCCAFLDWPPRRWCCRSSAVLFMSRIESSSVLLHRKDGTCVVQSGAWPHDALMYDDDGLFRSKAPYVTCFVWYDNNVVTKYCWSWSYLTKGGDWKSCKPKEYCIDGWTTELEQCDSKDNDSDDNGVVTNNCCGTPCTEFEKS